MEKQVSQTQIINLVLDVAIRRKAIILTLALIAIAVGLAVYLKQPKVYQSSSLLIFQAQKISPSKMSPDVAGRISDIVSTLSQVVQSRTSLEKIITTQGLYKEKLAHLPMQDVVESMRKNITIAPSRKGNTFQIRYKGSDPQKVVRVTNELASRFIEENLKYREEKASETSKYAQDELDTAKEELDKKEGVMRDYKLKYYNEMPDQSDNNMARLIALQEQYQGKQESIRDLERTRALIGDQIAGRRQLLQAISEGASPSIGNKEIPQTMSTRQLLNRLQNILASLQDRYTEQHPKIKSIKKKIARLEQLIASESGESSSSLESQPLKNSKKDEVIFDLTLQLKGITLEVENINKEKEKIKTQIADYEKWIAAIPFREAEWSSLTREYGERKRHYDFLVAQNLQARSALNLELKQKGSQFKIEDPARRPTRPVKPDFLKIMAMALFVGCGVGGGIAFCLEVVDTSFRDPSSLESAFGLEVICSVPHLPLRQEVLKKRIITISGTILFGLCSSALLVAMFYFYKKGMIIL